MRSFVSAAPAAAAVLVLAGLATAQVAPPEGSSLPYFDIRLDGDGFPTSPVRTAVAAARSESQRNARATELDRLQAAIPALRFDAHEFFDTVHFLRSTRTLLTAPLEAGSPRDARSVLRAFVAAHPGLFEIEPSEVDQAREHWSYGTRHNGVQHLVLVQQHAGIDIFGAHLKANVTAEGGLINVSSQFLPRTFTTASAVLSPIDALRSAAAHIGSAFTVAPTLVDGPHGANRKSTWSATPDFRSSEPIVSEFVWFPYTRLDLRPAWSLVVPELGSANTYEILVDASDGTILRRWNRLHHAGGNEPVSMRVYAGDSPSPFSPGHGSPSSVQPQVVARDFLTVGATPESPNGWIDDGVNETLGNNVDASTDQDGDNVPDLPRPQGNPYRVFDFAIDFGQEPAAYADASVTNLFYHCNHYHDRLYAFGFDEAAKNFQESNFGLGGVGGDRIFAAAQDTSFPSPNNATFGTSGSDGSSAQMQMFLWNGPNPDRDGALDAEVIYHEFSHGLSIRLSDGTVSGQQSGGMGEGWGDYFGFALLAEPGDDPNGAYALGAFSTFQLNGTTQNYYFGIRRFPYSTLHSISPLTYADTDPAQFSFDASIPANAIFIGNPANGVHNVGEIWCNTLIACRAAMWAQSGFAANEELMQLVVDGLKLQPPNPNMLDARDAILQADLVAHGGANLPALWSGFASRGLGANASSPSGGSSTAGVVEDFTIPSLIFFDYPDGTPNALQPGLPKSFTVSVSGIGGSQPIPGSGQLHVQINGGGFQAGALLETQPNVYTATLPATSCLEVVDYFISVDSTDGIIADPAGGGSYSAVSFEAVETVFDDDFESDLGWTVGTPDDDATTGIWERVDPIGTAAAPEIDVTEDGTHAYVTGQGSLFGSLGENDVDGGQTTLTSPSIDLSGGDARISYWRWYSNDTGAAPNADVFVIDISNDGGGTWTNVETVGPVEEASGGWIYHEFVVSDFVAPTGQVRLRFIASDEGAGSVVEAAVDEVRVERLVCEGGPPAIYCVAKQSSAGCVSAILTSDLAAQPTSGAGDYAVLCSDVQGEKIGLLFASTGGAAAVPFNGGTLCMNPPLKRGAPLFSGGSSATSCDGAFTQVVNDGNLFPAGFDAGRGNSGWYQYWYRDPANGSGQLATALSTAVELDFE